MEIFGVLILLLVFGIIGFYVGAWPSLKGFFNVEPTDSLFDAFRIRWNNIVKDRQVQKIKTQEENQKKSHALVRKMIADKEARKKKAKQTIAAAKAERTKAQRVPHPNPLAEDFFARPNVQSDLQNVAKMFKKLTISALREGNEPPEQVGYGRHTLESLEAAWNEEWQTALDEMGIEYGELFPKETSMCSPLTKVNTLELTTVDYAQRMWGEIKTELLESLEKIGTSSGGPH